VYALFNCNCFEKGNCLGSSRSAARQSRRVCSSTIWHGLKFTLRHRVPRSCLITARPTVTRCVLPADPWGRRWRVPARCTVWTPIASALITSGRVTSRIWDLSGPARSTNSRVMSQMYDQSVGLGPLGSSSLQGGRKPTVKDIKQGDGHCKDSQQWIWVDSSERIGLREYLTHGPSLTPDPIRKLKGKGQGDPNSLARKRRHSYDNVSTYLFRVMLFGTRSSPLRTECSEGELQYGEGSKREPVPQRDRNSVLKENRIVPHGYRHGNPTYSFDGTVECHILPKRNKVSTFHWKKTQMEWW
jgi:hypothetical protein